MDNMHTKHTGINWKNGSLEQSKQSATIFNQTLNQTNINCPIKTKLTQLSSKGQNHSLFKDTLKLEDHFTSLSRGNYINLTKFGRSVFPSATEIVIYAIKMTRGRNEQPPYMSFFKTQRAMFIPKYYYNHPNTIKFNQIMNVTSHNKLVKLCKFVKIIMDTFNIR